MNVLKALFHFQAAKNGYTSSQGIATSAYRPPRNNGLLFPFCWLLFSCIIFFEGPVFADSDAINRLFIFMPNSTISSSQMNAELNQLVNTANGKIGAATNSTISGAKTFSTNVTINAMPTSGNHVVTKMYVDGITLNHASAPPVYSGANTFTVAWIRERSSDGTTIIQTASPTTVDLTKVFDGSSVFGGLDTGTEAMNTIYYLYAVCRSDGSGAGLALSTINEAAGGAITLASGYTKKRQLPFWVMTNAVPNLLSFQVGAGWPDQPYVFYNAQQETAYNGASMMPGNTVFIAGVGPNTLTQYNVPYLPPICGRGVFHFVVDSNGVFTNFAFNLTGSGSTAFYVQGSYFSDQVRELPLTGTPSVWLIRNNGNGILYGDVLGGVVTGVN